MQCSGVLPLPAESRALLQPHYRKPIHAVYRDATVAFMAADSTLSVLSLAGKHAGVALWEWARLLSELKTGPTSSRVLKYHLLSVSRARTTPSGLSLATVMLITAFEVG